MNHQLNWINTWWQELFMLSAVLFTLSTHFEPYSYSWLLKIIPVGLLILYVSHNSQTDGNEKPNGAKLFVGIACSAG